MSKYMTRSKIRNDAKACGEDSHVSFATKSGESVHVSTLQQPSPSSYEVPTAISSSTTNPPKSLPNILNRKHTKLSSKDHLLLLHKQRMLRALNLSFSFPQEQRFVSRDKKADGDFVPADDNVLRCAIDSTLIFASENAGTAAYIHRAGLVVTCAHCVAESADEVSRLSSFWLLSASGSAVQARCVAWDERRDLALLRVIGTQDRDKAPSCFSIASSLPSKQRRILCIGHPGSEDLEAEDAGVSTDYPVLTISEGNFMGYANGQDIQDNLEIGALMHNAWTYWGHSGAPLVDASTGQLLGFHSSWDENTGMRRGVGVQALQEFLSNIDSKAEEVFILG